MAQARLAAVLAGTWGRHRGSREVLVAHDCAMACQQLRLVGDEGAEAGQGAGETGSCQGGLAGRLRCRRHAVVCGPSAAGAQGARTAHVQPRIQLSLCWPAVIVARLVLQRHARAAPASKLAAMVSGNGIAWATSDYCPAV
jgi:hypothetical protein